MPIGVHFQGVSVQEQCGPGTDPSTHNPEPRGGSHANEAQPGSQNTAEDLRNTDQWVRLPVSQLFSLRNARTDMSEVKQGSNNITANQRENWQSLALRTAYDQRQGTARRNDEPT